MSEIFLVEKAVTGTARGTFMRDIRVTHPQAEETKLQ